MSRVVILKNTSGSDIDLTSLGMTILTAAQRDVSALSPSALRDAPELIAAIQAGDITVNDGTNDLSVAIGEVYATYDVNAFLSTIINTSSDGIIVKDGNVVQLRQILGTTDQIVVTNADGIVGDISLAVSSDLIIPGTGGTVVPTGTTGERPGTPTNGTIRYNTTTNTFEYYENDSWHNFNDQNLFETIASDSGSTVANSTTDTLTIAGGTGISTSVSGDTLTITNDSPNSDQNIWLTVAADTGSTAASTTTDTLTIAGGTNITTSISGDTLTIDASGLTVSELPAIQVRRTTGITDIPTTWTDLTFDTTDVENDDTVIEHNDTNTDDIDIKEDGLYWIYYNLVCDDEIKGRVRINDTTVIPGSTKQSGDPADVNDILAQSSVGVIANLSANDKLTLQISATTTAENLQTDATLVVVKLQGAKGDQGLTGSGSNIIVKDEGINVTNTPHSTLDFVGDGVVVTDAGSGIATVTINGTPDQNLFQTIAVSGQSDVVADSATDTLTLVAGSNMTITTNASTDTITFASSGGSSTFGSEFDEASSDSESSTTSSYSQTKLTLTTASLTNGHKYRIGYSFECKNSDDSGKVQVDVAVSGTAIGGTYYQPGTSCSANYIMQSGFYYSNSLSGVKSITIKYSNIGYGTAYIKRARLEIWRVS